MPPTLKFILQNQKQEFQKDSTTPQQKILRTKNSPQNEVDKKSLYVKLLLMEQIYKKIPTIFSQFLSFECILILKSS